MIDLRHAATVDYESLRIDKRPAYPPVPVGVSIKIGARSSRYYAWGHPSGNNCSWGEAHEQLATIYDSGRPIVFHNANFDVDVGEIHMALPRLPWDRYHDTLPRLFLLDPRADTYSLKPSSERYLKRKPDERDAVVDWLVKNQPVPGVKISDKPGSEHYAGAYVAYAPVNIAGPYANGDVDRTFDLMDYTQGELTTRNMISPYDRERKLLLPLLDMERAGVRVDVRRLGRDIGRYHAALARLDVWLRRKLTMSNDANLDSDREIAAALIKAGYATKESLGVTATGQVSTSKESLQNGVKDKQIYSCLRYRSALGTCLSTFMEPWYAVAIRSGGLIYTRWHSTRTDHHGGTAGTRTGRLSSTPNFQNIPTEFDELFRSDAHPKLPNTPVELPPLPMVRSYVIADNEDEVLIDRDYHSQELRLCGYFEDGELKAQYIKEPWLDVHSWMQERIKALLGLELSRTATKRISFGLLYGKGIGSLAEDLDTDTKTARKLKDAYLTVLPGIKELYADMRTRAKAKEPIHTLGGREYFCEKPTFINGYMKTWDYKLVNLLIQGSAADVTKDAVILYTSQAPAGHKLKITVHDELTASVPRTQVREGMESLRASMEATDIDVPMLSEGYVGKNLEDMSPYDAKGKIVTRRYAA